MKKILLLLLLLLGMCAKQDLKYTILIPPQGQQIQEYITETSINMLEKGYIKKGQALSNIIIYQKIPNLENDIIITNKGVYIPYISSGDFFEYILLAKNLTMHKFLNKNIEYTDKEYVNWDDPSEKMVYIKKLSPAWYEYLKWLALNYFITTNKQLFYDITFEYIPLRQIFTDGLTEQTKYKFIKAIMDYESENNVEFVSLYYGEQNDKKDIYFMKYI